MKQIQVLVRAQLKPADRLATLPQTNGNSNLPFFGEIYNKLMMYMDMYVGVSGQKSDFIQIRLDKLSHDQDCLSRSAKQLPSL